MRKIKVVLLILIILIIPACTKQRVIYNVPEKFDYKEASNSIIEINNNYKDHKGLEAAKLNKELAETQSLSNKARILMKIKKLREESQPKK